MGMKPYDRHGNDIDDEDLIGDDSTNQGEGNKTAARRYNADVRAFVANDHVAGAARSAAGAMDSPEGPSLRAAEQRAAHKGRPSLVDRARGLFNRARNLVTSRVHTWRKAHAHR